MQLVSYSMNNSQSCVFVSLKGPWLKAHLSTAVHHLMAAQTHTLHTMKTSNLVILAEDSWPCLARICRLVKGHFKVKHVSFWTKSALLITTRTVWLTRGTYSSWWVASSSSGLVFWSLYHRSYSCRSCMQEPAERHRWPSEPAYVGHRDLPCPCTYTASACQSGPQHTATSETRQTEISWWWILGLCYSIASFFMLKKPFDWKCSYWVMLKWP